MKIDTARPVRLEERHIIWYSLKTMTLCMPSLKCPGKSAGLKCLLAALMLARMAALPGSAADLRIGVATTDITPPLGIPMAGYYHARGADGVLDPLFSKAMVIGQNDDRAAFVVLDIISVTRSITEQARAAIEQATGIKGDHVMISTTHAHTGPELARRGQRNSDMGDNRNLP